MPTLAVIQTGLASAQTAAGFAGSNPGASDSSSDAEDARLDAIFATPGQHTPVPDASLIPTAPGLERQLPSPRFTVNLLAPLFFNSNAEAFRTGGTSTLEGSPVLRLGWASPLFNLPVKVSAAVGVESDRFVNSNNADFDKIRINLRAQYVNPDNDQDYSPFIAYVPRIDMIPTFAKEFATRQDLNMGVAKSFNFGPDFTRVPFSGNTSAGTAWSFGLSAIVQRRFRSPAPESSAFILVPSLSYVISDQWNVSFAVDITRRWFDHYTGTSQRDFLAEPIATLEYALPDSWFGKHAGVFGRPSLDFQVAYEKNWSNVYGANYNIWFVGLALKSGWRF